MSRDLLPIIGMGIVALTACAYAYFVCRYWQKKADYWFTRCIEAEGERFRMVPRFDLHPLFHATRNYQSLDALLASAAPPAIRGEQ